MIRVLIVDDKQENLYLLRALLQGHGCTVDEARHGAEALTRARQAPPDLIVSDLLMPVMDGYTLLRQWKAEERLQTIPFVVYTATYTEPKDERLALDLGADAFIIKPVEPELLMARIQEVLAKKARGELPPASAPECHQMGLLKEYSEVLVNKLEAKVFQLEQANHALQEEMARRQQTEAELLQSRHDWEDIFQSIGHPTIIMDLEQGIVSANKECIEVTGKCLDELLNAKCYEVFHTNGKRPQVCPMEALLESGSTEKVEMEVLGGYYLVSCTPILDEEGNIRKVIHIATDITERKRAEDALRSEKDFSDTIMESLPGVFYLFRNDGNYLRWNRRLETITGYSYQDIDKMNFLNFFSEKNQPVIEEAIQQALDHGEVLVEADILTKDGNEIPYLFTGNQVTLNETQCVVGMGIDIRERKRLEDEIKFNNILLSTQQEVSIDGILVVDEDGKILSLNSRFVNMWDIAPEVIDAKADELALQSVLDKLKYPEEFLKKVNYLYAHQDETSWDEIALKDGRTFERYSAPMLGADGNYYGRVWYFRDITERKRAEEALRERERAWATLINNLPGFVYRCANDLNLTMLYVSNGCLEVTGYEAGDLIGNKNLAYNNIVHPAYRDFIWEKWQDLLSRKAVCEVEYPIITKGGETRWVWERGQGVFADDGQLQFLEGFITDITERRNAENQMRLNEARLQSLHDIAQYRAASTQDFLDFALNEAIKLTGSKVGYIYHYDEERRLFELNTWSKEVMKQCEVAQPQTLYELDKTGIWGEAVRQRKPIIVNDFQAPNPLKKGYPNGHVELHNFMTILVLADEKIVAVVGAGNKDSDYDETDVRQVSLLMDSVWRIAKSKRSETVQRRLATAVEHAAEGVLITDFDGTIEYVNKACEQMTGYEKEELLGRNPRILKSGEHDGAFYEGMWQTIKAGKVWSGLIINRKKDGRLYHEEATISPVKDSSGKIVNFVGVKRDITEHLELSKQLLQAQKMEAVGTLAGGVAHDFNNVLQVALGYSDLILADEDLPQRYRADLQKVHESARRGADLVQRLLIFSRKTDIKPQPINLNYRVKELRKMLERTIPKMIEIQLSLSENLATINADPTQVDQILMNLAVNARDAMPEGGKLLLETHNVVLDEDYARLHLEAESGQYVSLTITDTGTGMDKETLEHIFEPFYTTKGLGEGTGLGLAMVHGIVRQHGGHIRCYSEPGHGATFKIYFPAMVSDEVKEEEAVRKMPRGGSETILLVDDEELIRDLGARNLTKAGYKVITASDGKEALQVYQERSHDIDLVILDLIMPEMGGKQCLEGLLSLNPSAKVIIASGYSADGPTKDALAAGAKGFVNKPYDIRQVLGVVREVLDAE
ncbi:MAG: PAS domain S-box protein [Desulfomonilaceae bacterium]